MKTVNEIMKLEAKYLGFTTEEIMYGEARHLKLHRFVRAVAKSYAEQALDLAAEEAQISYTNYDPKLYDSPVWEGLDNDGRFFRIDKESILRLKEQLK